MSRTPTSKTLPIPPPISPLSTYSSAPRSRFSASASRFESPTLPVPPTSTPVSSGGKRKWPPPISRWTSHATPDDDSKEKELAKGKEKERTLDDPPPKRISMFTKIPLDADGVPSHIRREAPSSSSQNSSTPSTPTPLRPPNNTPIRTQAPGSRSGSSTKAQVSSNKDHRHEEKASGMRHAKSTSIANLSRLSVVRTRLAAMESQSSSPSSSSSSHSRSHDSKSFAPGNTSTPVKGQGGDVRPPDGLPPSSTSALSPPPVPSKVISKGVGAKPSSSDAAQVVNGVQGSIGPSKDSENVSGALKGLECKVDRVGGVVERVRGIVEEIEKSRHGDRREESLEKVRKDLRIGLEGIQAKLQEMQTLQQTTGTAAMDVSAVSPPGCGLGLGSGTGSTEVAEVRERLDALKRVGEETKEMVRAFAVTEKGDGKAKEILAEVCSSFSTIRLTAHPMHI